MPDDRNKTTYTGRKRGSTTRVGVLKANSTQFSITDGELQLAGAGLAMDSAAGDSGTATPTTAGVITWAGGTNITTVAGTNTVTVNLDDTISVAGDIVATKSSASADVTVECTNSDNTAADSDAFFEVAVGGTSGGNPGVRFQISGGQNYSMGIDNADSDKLVICADNDLGTDVLMKLDETTKDVEVSQGNLVIGAVAKQLQMNGGAVTDFIGQATLVSGTVTIANTNIAAADKIFIQRESVAASTTLGVLDVSISASTSFTITSLILGTPGSTQTGDVSIVNYFIVRQN